MQVRLRRTRARVGIIITTVAVVIRLPSEEIDVKFVRVCGQLVYITIAIVLAVTVAVTVAVDLTIALTVAIITTTTDCLAQKFPSEQMLQ